MPFEGQILIEDHGDDGFVIPVDRKLITECGAQRMQELLDSHIAGGQQELDHSTVISALRAARG
ncbi:hypothetical protein ACFU3E_17265 [Streptomyces sp. NPDC057424]|uniref:hypothetical protein n=1 Tax=Streptomyces sp. NPDC057424 TaxID=3346127 RepID=UPI0036B552A0